MTANIKLYVPDLYTGGNPIFIPAALEANLIGAWGFGKAALETNDEAAQRCSINRLVGSSRGAADRKWIGGVPTFYSNYARFLNSQPLVTTVADVGLSGGCYFAIARCQDTTVGVTSPDRAMIGGNYAGNTNEGFGIEFSSYSSGAIRALDSNAAGTVAQNSVTTATDDLGKWRMLYSETKGPSPTDGTLAMVNLNPADGSSPDPTDTPLTGGRKVGTQTIAIGGRISDSTSNYTPTVHKDIAWFLAFNAIPSGPQRALIKSQLEAICTAIGITLGA